MRKRRPSPTELITQLAERVVRDIHARSHARFDATLDELTEYHRFLLEAYSTRADDGTPESYARIQLSWQAPYQEWKYVYFDVIDAAVSLLHEDNHYVKALAYLPQRLLPRDTEYGSDLPTNDLLGLVVVLLYRLEAWLGGVEKRATDVAVLPQSADRPSGYDSVLMSVVSAWEATLNYGTVLRDYQNVADIAQRWNRLRSGCSLVLRHLQNTAEFFTIAVWNRDALGETRFRDLFLRWRRNSDLPDLDFYGQGWTPQLDTTWLTRPWPEVSAAIARFAGPDLTPEAVFGTIMGNTYEHLVLTVCCMLVNWRLAGKADGASVDAAARLFRGEAIEPERFGPRIGIAADFKELFFLAMHMHLSGARSEPSTHGVFLDEIIRTLDRISERPVQSGRGYVPTTIHSRDDLATALGLVLTAAINQNEEQAILAEIDALVANEALLPQGDRTVLRILSFLELIDTSLNPIDDTKIEIVRALEPGMDFAAAATCIRRITATAKEQIGELRTRRIKEREVDENKIESLEKLVDSELLEGHGHLPIFQPARIALVGDDIPLVRVPMMRAPKTELAKPEMGYQSSNFFEVAADAIANSIGNQLWESFDTLDRVSTALDVRPSTVLFWRQVEELAATVGSNPCLTLDPGDFEGFSQQIMYRPNGDLSLRAAHDRSKAVRFAAGHYAVTVNGIDVFIVRDEPRRAFLFSRSMLREVHYRRLAGGHATTIAFRDVTDDPWNGLLDLEFGQRFVWEPRPILELNLPASADEKQL